MKKISKSLLVLLLMIQMITPIQALSNQWQEFRDFDNVIQTFTPESMEKTQIAWSKDFTEGWDAMSDPIIVDNEIFVATATNSKLFKLNMNGEVMKEMTLAGTLGYNINIAHGDGMIFIPMSDGRIQAVDSQTMTSLWLTEATDGYVQGKFAYQDGYLYVGSMNSAFPNSSGSFYAINTTDTDPKMSDEVKTFTWEYVSNATKGGYDWAKAIIANDKVYFGGSDGKLVAHHKTNNEVLETLEIGESISSALTLHNNHLYFSTKAGNVHSVELTANGFGKHTTQAIDSTSTVESTSSPTIANNRLYVGFGRGFGQKGGIAVLDSSTLKVIYTIDTTANVQASLLVTTAYKNNIAYFTMNDNPGGVYALVDDATTNTGEIKEIYIPTGEAINYCMTSLIADQDGAIYHYNDSGYLTKLVANQTQSIKTFFDEVSGITAKGLFDEHGVFSVTQVKDAHQLVEDHFAHSIGYEGFNFKYLVGQQEKAFLSDIEISKTIVKEEGVELSLINIDQPDMLLPFTLNQSTISFKITKPGTYLIVESKEESEKPVETPEDKIDTPKKEVPNTGDKTNTFLFVGIGAVAIVGVIVLVATKKKK